MLQNFHLLLKLVHGLCSLPALEILVHTSCLELHLLIANFQNKLLLQIFRKEPFFYGHDNHDQLVKIAKVHLIYDCELSLAVQLL